MEKEQLELLKEFIGICKINPDILHSAELDFFKEWVESLGAKIPPKAEKPKPQAAPPKTEPAPEPAPSAEVESESEEESDIELNTEGVIEPDTDPAQPMPEASEEITEEKEDEYNNKFAQAQNALSEGDLENAITLYTEALQNNPGSARAWAKRACVYIKLMKPNAAIRDCDKALEINPDSAQALKWRGRGHMLLGNWEKSLADLQNTQKIDYDEQTNNWLKQVTPNAKKIREHKHKYEMKRAERELKKRKERIQKAKEERARAQREEEERRQATGGAGGFPGGMPGGFPGGMPGGFPGGMPGGFQGSFPGGMPGGFPGGMPGGFPGGMPGASAQAGAGMPDLNALLNDPELLSAFQDPEVASAFQDVSQNPANISKYQNNPKVKAVIDKLTKKFAGSAPSGDAEGGMPGEVPGGMPGGFGDPPSGGAGSASTSSSTFDVD